MGGFAGKKENRNSARWKINSSVPEKGPLSIKRNDGNKKQKKAQDNGCS